MESSVEGVLDSDLHEEEPRDLDKGISIQNLLKIYDDVRTQLHTCMYMFSRLGTQCSAVLCMCCVYIWVGGEVKFPFLLF